MLDYCIILFMDYEKSLCPLFPQYKVGKSVIELENLVSNHQVLIKQMTSNNELFPKLEDVLYVKDKRRLNFHSEPSSRNENQFRSEELSKKPFTICYKCGKPDHFKRDCRVKVVCDRC